MQCFWYIHLHFLEDQQTWYLHVGVPLNHNTLIGGGGSLASPNLKSIGEPDKLYCKRYRAILTLEILFILFYRGKVCVTS